jgi:hypothetical protein
MLGRARMKKIVIKNRNLRGLSCSLSVSSLGNKLIILSMHSHSAMEAWLMETEVIRG